MFLPLWPDGSAAAQIKAGLLKAEGRELITQFRQDRRGRFPPTAARHVRRNKLPVRNRHGDEIFGRIALKHHRPHFECSSPTNA
jgi:hypothetical protein